MSGYSIGPIEMGHISAAQKIAARLEDGETVPYEVMDALGDRETDDLFRRLDIVEVPGDGWKLTE